MIFAQASVNFEQVMPVTPQEFIADNVVAYIEPELIAVVSAIAGISVFKALIFRR